MSAAGTRYLRFGAAIAIIVLALGYLAFTGVQESKSYYVTIGELKTMGDGAYSKRLRVAGQVQSGSIKRHGTHLEFALVEQNVAAVDSSAKIVKSPDGKPWLLNVEYSGMDAPPDTFKDESQALVEGKFGRDGLFHAQQIQAKCASKYAPAAQPAKTANAAPATAASSSPQ